MDELLDIKMPPKEEPAPEMVIEEREEEEEEEVPEPEPPKEHIPDEEVFNDAPVVKKVKRKCSEKQLQHLAKCREKALEKKKKDKDFKDQQKAKQRRYVEQERKQAPPPRRKKVQVKPEPEYYSEEEEYYQEEVPQQEQYPEIFHKLTASEIRAIQKDAINDYEIVRKERKHHKQLAQQQAYIDQERRKVMGMINGKSPNPENDPWAGAFSF